jgi:hypothetical protein
MQRSIKSGRWRLEKSQQVTEKEFKELLPDGLATPNQYLYAKQDDLLGTKIRTLWFAVQERGIGQEAFVYDVVIFEAYHLSGLWLYCTVQFSGSNRVRGSLFPLDT